MSESAASNRKLKFYVVDFAEGSQIVQGSWLSDDLSVCSWPTWGGKLDQVLYDKKMRATSSPQADWTDYNVLRIRAKGDNFEYVRKKLREAVLYEETDLNTDATDAEAVKPKRRRIVKSITDDESDEELSSILDKGHGDFLEKLTKKKLPEPPKNNFKRIEVSATIHHNKNKIKTSTQPLTPTGTLNPIKELNSTTSTPTSKISNSSVRNSICTSPTIADVTITNDPTTQNGDKPIVDEKISDIAKKMTEFEFRAFVIKNLINCNRRMAVIQKELHNFKGTNNRHTVPNINQQVLNDVPIYTTDDMAEWDRKLDNKDFSEKVTLSLAQLGGEDYASCTRAILTKVMSNSCAEMYSYFGSRGKKIPFHSLNFKDVLFSAVRMTSDGKLFSSVTDGQLAAVVKGWLRLASGRAGGSGTVMSKRRLRNIDDTSRLRNIDDTSRLRNIDDTSSSSNNVNHNTSEDISGLADELETFDEISEKTITDSHSEADDESSSLHSDHQ